MTTAFKEIKPEDITDNILKLIGSEWMLITAGTKKSFNMMTASWGGSGVIWHRNICWCVIRPQRYTFSFMEKTDFFTLCFFNNEYKSVLEFCGSHSGKDVDKIAETKLTPVETSHGSIYFKEARLVIECKKIYFHDIDPKHFIDPTIQDNYSSNDYHRMYIGEIIRCLKQ